MGEELERERQVLERSKLDIADGQDRIDRQLALLGDMTSKGHDTQEGERLLQLLREALAHWARHQELIVDRIMYLELKEEKPER